MRARIKRLAKHSPAWLAAFFVSISLIGCTEEEAERMAPPTPATANESRTETALPTDSVSTDTNAPDAIIEDWTDGKAGELEQITEEEYEKEWGKGVPHECPFLCS